ncbi:MAG: Uma2 family endonuclease [Chloroflexales bacterium]|nr:Uma2 family endonuclease [Chloroflexales bacterium]
MATPITDQINLHSYWTPELVEQIPHVQGARFDIIDGELHVTSTIPAWTTDIVEQMPQIEGERYELMDGDLFVTTQPHLRHQNACTNIVAELNAWSRSGNHGIAIFAPGLVYGKGDAVAPDVVWVSAARRAAVFGADGKLHDSPELVVEMLSPGKKNEKRDRERKLDYYARHDIQEYWIADWRTVTIEVYRRDDAGLALAQTLQAGDTITSPLLPGFSCVIDRFFEL